MESKKSVRCPACVHFKLTNVRENKYRFSQGQLRLSITLKWVSVKWDSTVTALYQGPVMCILETCEEAAS